MRFIVLIGVGTYIFDISVRCYHLFYKKCDFKSMGLYKEKNVAIKQINSLS